MKKSVIRFIGLGATTTLASYTTYVIALQFLSPMAAYGCALVISCIIQAGLMAPFVFESRLTLKKAALSLSIYLGYSAMFATLMWVALSLSVPPLLAPFAVIVVAAPLQFFAGRYWVRDPLADVRAKHS